MKAPLYNLNGQQTGDIELAKKIFGARWNADLVKQVVDSLLSSKRKPVAHTKTRGEVSGGGRKPWRQKGTGRARHGSIRSPIWVGGGVAHGPRKDKKFERKVTKKMRLAAFHALLSAKLRDGEVLFLEDLYLSAPKTREAVKILQTLSGIKGFERIASKKKNALIIALSSKKREVERAFGNISNVKVVEARNLDPLTLLQYKYLLIENPQKTLSVLPGASKHHD